MPTKLQIVTSILAFVLAQEVVIVIKNRGINARNRELFDTINTENETLTHALAVTSAQLDYTFHILNENEIRPDEFDLIAMYNAE